MLRNVVFWIAFSIGAVIAAVIAAWLAGIVAILLIEEFTGYKPLAKFDPDAAELGEHLTTIAYGVAAGAAVWGGNAVYVVADRNLSRWRSKRKYRRLDRLEHEVSELRRELDERR
jgi:hypothetical protein